MSARAARLRILSFFKEAVPDSGQWQCVCGKTLKQKKGSGWTNLSNHLNSQHPGWRDDGGGRQTTLETSGFTGTTKKADNIYSWMEWVCVGMKPFSFVTDPLTRKYTNLDDISTNTVDSDYAM